ncbi:conserved hypothetical protein [Trichinella spiralis]|uniref:hypothetical protein n=1 Tax=Trichinella spiralis TaxID=6334 RepID=UPI0001EFEB5C|nr:conserved hypothetical protein [Trichinella spiralis]
MSACIYCSRCCCDQQMNETVEESVGYSNTAGTLRDLCFRFRCCCCLGSAGINIQQIGGQSSSSSSYLLVFFIFVQFRVCRIPSRRTESFMITIARGRRVVGKLVQCLEVTVVNGRHRFARIENTIRTLFHHDTVRFVRFLVSQQVILSIESISKAITNMKFIHKMCPIINGAITSCNSTDIDVDVRRCG